MPKVMGPYTAHSSAGDCNLWACLIDFLGFIDPPHAQPDIRADGGPYRRNRQNG